MAKKVLFEKGTSHQSRSDGAFLIVSDNGWDNVDIIFPSGYESNVCRQQIKEGRVKDYFKPIYFGVGFLGGRELKSKSKGRSTSAYNRWKHMLARCYDKETQERMPTYKGCTVCDEWHNFQNYAKWFYENYAKNCDVDKDIIKSGNKIYSPSTCKFVPHQENSEKATAKNYKFKSPLGELISIYNLNKFCLENNLTQANMRKVIDGTRSHHKGWTI